MENFPLDLSLNILSRLPVVSLINCKHVSKAWQALVTHPSLPYLHHAYHESQNNPCVILHSSSTDQLYLVDSCSDLNNTNQPSRGLVKRINTPLDDHKFNFVLHCNGLLCLSYTEVDDMCTYSNFYVYNLFNAELIKLPPRRMTREYKVVYGFGFHPRTREYKIVTIVEHECVGYNSSLGTCELSLDQSIEVFTLGSSEWRIKENNPSITMQSCEALVNGALHWFGQAKHNGSENIVAFDLMKEEFCQIPSPHCRLEGINSRLLVLGGCLALAVYTENNKIDVWLMKGYGVNESWTKEFTINPEFPLLGFIRPLCLLKKGEILIEYEKQALFSYESDTKKIKKMEVSNLPHSFEAVLHIKSFNSVF